MTLNINHQLNIIHGMHTTCSNDAHLLHTPCYLLQLTNSVCHICTICHDHEVEMLITNLLLQLTLRNLSNSLVIGAYHRILIYTVYEQIFVGHNFLWILLFIVHKNFILKGIINAIQWLKNDCCLRIKAATQYEKITYNLYFKNLYSSYLLDCWLDPRMRDAIM